MTARATPMLATLTDAPFSDERWVFERKLDGVRALCSSDGRHIALWSRNGRSIGESYPEILDAVAGAQASFVVDGEIVAFDGAQTSFAALQQRIHLTGRRRIEATGVRVYYYLFDLLHWGDRDLRGLALRERKQLLREAFEFTDPLRFTPHRNTAGEAIFADSCARGREGVIAKRAGAPYRHGRSGDWLKFKCVRDQEFVVGGFTEPAGSRAGFGALLVGYYADSGELHYAGKVGTGYDEYTLRSLRARLGSRARAHSPFAGRVREGGAHWVEPETVVEIGFTEWTADGKLRHPRFLGTRSDKDPRDVLAETQ